MTSRLKNHKRPGRLYDPLEYSYLSNKRASSNKRSRAQILQNRTPQIINKTVKLVFIQKMILSFHVKIILISRFPNI